MRRGYADTPGGQVHYVTAGAGPPVLLLHQTPRSSDEYRDALPLLARDFRVVAMDTVGYGGSYKPARRCGIPDYARGAVDFLDALGIARTAVVGHHTGAVIGLELAAGWPERVSRLVLSASPWIDAAERARRGGRAVVDHAEPRDDGGHLAELWAQRMRFYPKGRRDLLERFLMDALRAGEEKMAEGHLACSAYPMEERIGLVRCPTLVVCASGDPFAFPKLETVARHLPGSRTAVIPGGTVAVVDEMPDTFVAAIRDFLREGP
jgi:pimeloyl-ACP methyl ester carboxylesterase